MASARLCETEAVGTHSSPQPDGPDSFGIVDDAKVVVSALTRFKVAQGAIDVAQIYRPINAMKLATAKSSKSSSKTG